MKSENKNSANGTISKSATVDKPAQDSVVKAADHDLTAKVGPEVAVKTAEPVAAKKA